MTHVAAERSFGFFFCRGCGSRWRSGFAYPEVPQQCNKCFRRVKPFSLQPLIKAAQEEQQQRQQQQHPPQQQQQCQMAKDQQQQQQHRGEGARGGSSQPQGVGGRRQERHSGSNEVEQQRRRQQQQLLRHIGSNEGEQQHRREQQQLWQQRQKQPHRQRQQQQPLGGRGHCPASVVSIGPPPGFEGCLPNPQLQDGKPVGNHHPDRHFGISGELTGSSPPGGLPSRGRGRGLRAWRQRPAAPEDRAEVGGNDGNSSRNVYPQGGSDRHSIYSLRDTNTAIRSPANNTPPRRDTTEDPQGVGGGNGGSKESRNGRDCRNGTRRPLISQDARKQIVAAVVHAQSGHRPTK